MTIDITAIVTAHREGLLAPATLATLARAVEIARVEGLNVEIVVMLDRADALTREVFQHFSETRIPLEMHEVDFGDPGASRNAAVRVARGRWIALLDADDLWCADWLVASFRAAESDSRSIVWHPEVNVYFGVNPHVFVHADMDAPEYELSHLAVRNDWTSLSFARRELFEAVPYRPSKLSAQIGYEDWTWNMDVISAGAIHKTVKGTGHAIRTKRGASVVQSSNAARCLPHPSPLFRELLEGRAKRARSSLTAAPSERRA